MNTTIALGKELSVYSRRITNVFTTINYMKRLRDAYVEHVDDFYKPSRDNGFTLLYDLSMLLADKSFTPVPCNTPMSDIDSSMDELRHIMDNKKAYRNILNILIDKCKGTNDAGFLLTALLKDLRSANRNFKDTAMNYDYYMGDTFSVAEVIRAVHAYGDLTGLVDYYNMDEGK